MHASLERKTSHTDRMDAPPPPPSHGAEVAVSTGASVSGGAAGLKEAGNKAFTKGDLEQAHKVRHSSSEICNAGTNGVAALLCAVHTCSALVV